MTSKPQRKLDPKLESNPKPQLKLVDAKVTITPPNMATATVTISGTAPYLQNRFSSENRDKMLETQKAWQSPHNAVKHDPEPQKPAVRN